MKFIFLFCTVILLLSSCVQTRTLTTNDQKLNEFYRADYIGTFSAIYYIDAKKNLNIDPVQTLQSIYKNDSIVRNRVKSINFTNQNFDTTTSTKLNKELLSVLNYVKKEGKVKNYRSSGVFDEIGSLNKSNYNIYFISTGFLKDTILAKKEANIKTINLSLMVLSGFAFGLTGVLVYNSVANTLSVSFPVNMNYLYYKEAYEGEKGLRGFIIVYDKLNKNVCYVREQFFSSSKNPLDLKALNKQIKNVFKEIYF